MMSSLRWRVTSSITRQATIHCLSALTSGLRSVASRDSMVRVPMRRGVKLLTWYRVLPLLIVLLFGAISFVYSFGPSLVFKSMYPLEYEDEITSSATAHGVDPYLVAAVIRSESSWDPHASSHQGQSA